ncbi:Phosphoenolpyruvate carboxylase [Trichinella spiralis]|uniref:Phosphoenolpyruvate carboxylase n=1 Tax=Trichinella spiralis TaxID=6334 RepID=A0ABR3KN53_TRISP
MNVRRLASYRLLLSNIESSLQWNKRRQSHLKLIIASWPVVCQLVLKRIERETFDRSMVGHFIAAFSVLSNAETMLFKTDGSNNFHLHHHLVEYDALLLLLTMLFDDRLFLLLSQNYPLSAVFFLWPSVNHRVDLVPWDFLVRCFEHFFDDWRRSIIC